MTDQHSSHAVRAPTINDPAYWDQRFATDWEPLRGREQTAFFARAALAALPEWLKSDIALRRLALYDLGCALGDALPVLQAAFPTCVVSGGDIAPSGISRARALYPQFSFDLLDPHRPPPRQDVLYCSNTLEHFEDWRERLEALAEAARAYVILVVPFAEIDLIAEHEVSFGYRSLPLHAGAHRLATVTTYDTARLPNSLWPGRQMTAIYARAAPGAGGATILNRDHVILDFRGQDDTAVTASLQAADAFDAALAPEIAAHEALKLSFERAVAELDHFKALLADAQNHSRELAAHFDAQHLALSATLTEALTEARAYSERIARDHEGALQDLIATRAALHETLGERDAALETIDELRGAVRAGRNLVGRMTDQIADHNAAIDQVEGEIAAHMSAAHTALENVLTSRTWRALSRTHATIARIRRRAFRPQTMPAKIDATLPRLDIGPLLETPAQSGRARASATALPLAGQANKRRSGPRALLTVSSLHRGGVEQVVIDLAHGLAELDYRVGVAVADKGGDSADQLIAEGFDVRVFGNDPIGFSAFARELNPEFALANHCYMGFDELKAAGAPIIDIVHNYYVWHQDAPEDFRRMSAAMARCVAVSTGVADYHARTFGIARDRIAVINNPINRQGLLRPEPQLLKRARDASRATFTFVNIAQFFPAKAHAVLISAFAEVYARFPQARLVLLGEHVDETVAAAVREAIARHDLGAAVDMPGFLNRRALSHRLASAHAFVQPSVYEGFSVAMAEAAHFALPIIATRVGGAMDLVNNDDCGILIPPHIEDLGAYRDGPIHELGMRADAPNRDALIDAMTRMIQARDEWQERGFIGQARIDALTPKTVAQRYVALAESVR